MHPRYFWDGAHSDVRFGHNLCLYVFSASYKENDGSKNVVLISTDLEGNVLDLND